MLEWVAPVLKETLFITALVMMMMVLLEYVHLGTHGGLVGFLRRHRRQEVLLGGGLGAVPGCAGGFLGVSLYSHGMMSFGALLAMMIATVGDDGLFLLAANPKWGIGVAAGMLAAGLLCGWLWNLLPAKSGSSRNLGEGHYPVHEQDLKHRPWGPWHGLGWQRAVLLAGLALFSLGVAFGVLGDADGGEAPVWEGGEILARVLFSAMGLAAFLCVWKSTDHFVGEHLWHHLVKQHFLKVFLWTLAVLALVKWSETRWDFGELLDVRGGRWLVFGISVALGWLPTAGPNMFVIGLFRDNVLSPAVLVANSIVQDGHASLPLLAESRKAYVAVKAIKTLVALGTYAAWEWLAPGM